jgi:hypothetical protein
MGQQVDLTVDKKGITIDNAHDLGASHSEVQRHDLVEESWDIGRRNDP